jgi:hypothetical protein
MEDYDEERLSTHRMLLGAKPVAFPGGGWIPKGRDQWVRQARKVLTFGMPPGPAESRREELKALMPVVRRVAEAGWQPVPHARGAGLWIERFGTRPGRLYLTVRNCGRKPVTSRLTIELERLGLAGMAGRLAVRQISPERPVRFVPSGSRLAGQVTVPAQETIVLALTHPAESSKRKGSGHRA